MVTSIGSANDDQMQMLKDKRIGLQKRQEKTRKIS